MTFQLLFTGEAQANLRALMADKGLSKRLKSVRKSLGLLQTNPRHPSLQTHKFQSIKGPGEAEVFEAYAEQNTPAAYRIFFHYGPGKKVITIIAIVSHP